MHPQEEPLGEVPPDTIHEVRASISAEEAVGMHIRVDAWGPPNS